MTEGDADTAEYLFDGDHLRMSWFDAGRTFLLVTFDHWQPDRSDFGSFERSQFWTRQGVSQLRIGTRHNDWFLNPETAEIESLLAEFRQRFERVHALAFSMGGFGALRLSKALNANRMLLFSPQASVWSEDVQDSFWCRAYKGTLGRSTGLHESPVKRGQSGTLVFDPDNRDDTRHANLCATLFPKLELCPISGSGHSFSRLLSVKGSFAAVQKASLKLGRCGDFLRSRCKVLQPDVTVSAERPPGS
ncbi:hypothetical protein [Palleronia caenipelagi]|uniref:Alpha/beta hydrolase n=1 Tax=Palleronia caenipelagi TaxID=2489174 RepID=A0A547Q7V1_9RHOB|nr:hypothetical protein [Palleronia caenipelagi]TRD22462.1 hypothetical protein FEV53_05235 [Palleronia caenipelagi]